MPSTRARWSSVATVASFGSSTTKSASRATRILGLKRAQPSRQEMIITRNSLPEYRLSRVRVRVLTMTADRWGELCSNQRRLVNWVRASGALVTEVITPATHQHQHLLTLPPSAQAAAQEQEEAPKKIPLRRHRPRHRPCPLQVV